MELFFLYSSVAFMLTFVILFSYVVRSNYRSLHRFSETLSEDMSRINLKYQDCQLRIIEQDNEILKLRESLEMFKETIETQVAASGVSTDTEIQQEAPLSLLSSEIQETDYDKVSEMISDGSSEDDILASTSLPKSELDLLFSLHKSP